MVYGLRLAGTVADAAALEILATACPELVESSWCTIAEPDGRGSALFCEALERRRARALADHGVEVVRIEGGPQGFTVEAPGDGKIESWPAEVRRAETLLEALRPVPVDGDPIATEALFVVGGSARPLLERLLLLGRDDARVVELEDGGTRLFCVRMTAPPLYLLMRARDQREEHTVAYASAGTPRLWIEWGFMHPLARIAARAVEHTDKSALIDASGRWRFGPRELAGRSIFDAVEPALPADRLDLTPSPDRTRFVVQLRFAPGPEHEPDLWLLDADRFFSLEHFVQDAGDEEIRRLTVARLDRGDGRPLYLLRERMKPGVTRFGTRLSDLVGSRGFTKNTATDNLYLPVGRRLVPKVGREELRRLLSLEDAMLVIVDEDRDGPKVLRVPEVEESSLAEWVQHVATDRRLELDLLLERTVFSFPPMDVERAAASMKAPPAMPPPEPEPRVVGSKRSKPAVEPVAVRAEPDELALDDLAEIRVQARALETELAKGGSDDPEAWRRLAELETRLGEIDEAAACLENALFFGRLPRPSGKQSTPASGAGSAGFTRAGTGDLISDLRELRARTYEHAGVDLVDLVLKDGHAPREAAYLAARFVEAVSRGDRLMDDMVQVALQTFAEPGLPISRRMAWVALSSWHRRVDDKLGLTRAREALLGALNDRGLSELYDLPRFVRYALALEDDEVGTNGERSRVEQLEALERLLTETFGRVLPDFDVMANFVRVLFAIGMMRLGASAHARVLVASVEHELPAHDAPNQALYRLYLARMAFEGAESDPSAWRSQVEQILSAADERGRRPAAWLAKRSIWLGATDDKPVPRMRTLIDRLLAAAEDERAELGATLTRLATDRVYRLYDWELVVVIERLMKVALATGSDDVIAEVLEAAQAQLPSMEILGHRVRAIAACLKGAATIDHTQRVEWLVDRIIEVTAAADVPWVRELLLAVNPCLSILRRLGASEPAARLLDSLEPVPLRTKLESSLLWSTLAAGYLQLGKRARADELIERSLAIVFDGELDYVSRFEGGALAIEVLRHWPTYERALHYRRYLRGLEHFKDLYTTSEWFEAHKILLLERIIDAVADSATRQSDRVQAFLDLEEHAVRSKIILDWKEQCGA